MPPIPLRTAQGLGIVTGFLLLTGPVWAPQSRPAEILGWWHGTSLCVRASWNAGCNDEVIQYQIVPTSADSTESLMRADKLVNGRFESMGDLPLHYNAASHSWDGDFANARVSIRWTYQVQGDTLRGLLLLRPDLKVARNVLAQRGKQETGP